MSPRKDSYVEGLVPKTAVLRGGVLGRRREHERSTKKLSEPVTSSRARELPCAHTLKNMATDSHPFEYHMQRPAGSG
jgi:hypothetical protein